MHYTIQIHTGSLGNPTITTDELLNRLDHICDHFRVDTLIYGWSLEAIDFYRIKEACSSKNIAVYAWLPVFSELEAYVALNPFVTSTGEPLKPYVLSEDEHFTFCCPSDPQNQAAIAGFLDDAFPYYAFDGVFFDRIRYPSPIHGPEVASGCHCPHCTQMAQGPQVPTLKPSPNPKPDPNHHKREVITLAISKLATQFRKKGLKVGLDLFAKPFNDFVGQDFDSLSAISDFIKPMYYQYTHAPAGMPFEAKALAKVCPDLGMDQPQAWLPTEDHFGSLAKAHGRALRVGIEWNKIPNIALTSKETLHNQLTILHKSGVDHVVLSWNAMLVPQDHLDVIKGFDALL